MLPKSQRRIDLLRIIIAVAAIILIIAYVSSQPTKAAEPNAPKVTACTAMTPEEAIIRFPETKLSDWRQPIPSMIIYESLEETFLEAMVMPDEIIKAFDDDALATFYDSFFGEGRMHVSAVKLNFVCLDSYQEMPFVDDAPTACPINPADSFAHFGGQPDGWSSREDDRLKLTVLSYVASSASDWITLIVPKEVWAVVNGHSFGPGQVIPNVASATLRMYCSQDLTVGN